MSGRGGSECRSLMLPRVQPIAPIPAKEPFDDAEWLFDFKYDGFRALCYLEQAAENCVVHIE